MNRPPLGLLIVWGFLLLMGLVLFLVSILIFGAGIVALIKYTGGGFTPSVPHI